MLKDENLFATKNRENVFDHKFFGSLNTEKQYEKYGISSADGIQSYTKISKTSSLEHMSNFSDE